MYDCLKNFIGVYLLDVSSIHDIFPQMKIKVSAEDGKISVIEYKYLGAKSIRSSYPIILTALGPLKYFKERQPFSILGMILGNPMIILMVILFIKNHKLFEYIVCTICILINLFIKI